MDLAHVIDHTLLRPDCLAKDIAQLCKDAVHYKFAAVCIPPFFVRNAYKILCEQKPQIATVVGFPMGYSTTPAKVEEVKKAINDGVDEIDMVVNVCAIKNDNWSYVENDISSVTTACHIKGKIVKIIFETGLLSEQEVIRLCQICTKIGVDFVKTSTGFNGAGASIEVVKLLRKHLPEKIKIKASGGIRTSDFAQALVEAGAERLGCSKSIEIVSG